MIEKKQVIDSFSSLAVWGIRVAGQWYRKMKTLFYLDYSAFLEVPGREETGQLVGIGWWWKDVWQELGGWLTNWLTGLGGKLPWYMVLRQGLHPVTQVTECTPVKIQLIVEIQILVHIRSKNRIMIYNVYSISHKVLITAFYSYFNKIPEWVDFRILNWIEADMDFVNEK